MQHLKYIGKVSSTLKQLSDCPLQEKEGAPEATIHIQKEYWPALTGLKKKDQVIVFTWLHQGDRRTLITKPRNNPNAKDTGVFATRSPSRPNPIGIHMAKIVDINDSGEIILSNLEVLDGTPVIDIKPVI